MFMFTDPTFFVTVAGNLCAKQYHARAIQTTNILMIRMIGRKVHSRTAAGKQIVPNIAVVVRYSLKTR